MLAACRQHAVCFFWFTTAATTGKCPSNRSRLVVEPKKVGAGFKPALTTNMQILLQLSYAFPAAFNPRSTFSGLSGSVLMRTPVAL